MRVIVSPPPPPAPLLGSTKQVRWATTIRADVLAEADMLRSAAAERLRRGLVIDADIERVRVLIDAADSLARDCAEAGWWIDRRGHSASSLLIERGRVLRLTAADAAGR